MRPIDIDPDEPHHLGPLANDLHDAMAGLVPYPYPGIAHWMGDWIRMATYDSDL